MLKILRDGDNSSSPQKNNEDFAESISYRKIVHAVESSDFQCVLGYATCRIYFGWVAKKKIMENYGECVSLNNTIIFYFLCPSALSTKLAVDLNLIVESIVYKF